jgi:hypothetical protein
MKGVSDDSDNKHIQPVIVTNTPMYDYACQPIRVRAE